MSKAIAREGHLGLLLLGFIAITSLCVCNGAVERLASPSGCCNTPSGGTGAYAAGQGSFDTWNMVRGTNNWGQTGDVSAYSGCQVPAGGTADDIVPIVRICIKAGNYLDHIYFLFKVKVTDI